MEVADKSDAKIYRNSRKLNQSMGVADKNKEKKNRKSRKLKNVPNCDIKLFNYCVNLLKGIYNINEFSSVQWQYFLHNRLCV